MPEARERRRSTLTVALAVAGPLLLLLFYLGGYVWLRGTHRLVHEAYGTITAPFTTFPRAGPTVWETVYAPAIAVESRVRAVIDPSWSPPAMPASSMMDGS